MANKQQITSKAEIPDKTTLKNTVSAINEPDAEIDQKEIKDIVERNTIDVSKALTLRLKNGLSYQEIANQFNVTKQAVWARLKPFERFVGDPDSLKAYDSNRAKILNSAELRMVSELLDEDKLKSASVNNLAYAAKNLFDMRRLDQGESTANVSYYVLSQKIEELDQEEARLRAEIEGN